MADRAPFIVVAALIGSLTMPDAGPASAAEEGTSNAPLASIRTAPGLQRIDTSRRVAKSDALFAVHELELEQAAPELTIAVVAESYELLLRPGDITGSIGAGNDFARITEPVNGDPALPPLVRAELLSEPLDPAERRLFRRTVPLRFANNSSTRLKIRGLRLSLESGNFTFTGKLNSGFIGGTYRVPFQ